MTRPDWDCDFEITPQQRAHLEQIIERCKRMAPPPDRTKLSPQHQATEAELRIGYGLVTQ